MEPTWTDRTLGIEDELLGAWQVDATETRRKVPKQIREPRQPIFRAKNRDDNELDQRPTLTEQFPTLALSHSLPS